MKELSCSASPIITTTTPDDSRFEALWDDRQLAKALNVSPRTPANWRYRGGGPPFIMLSNLPRYCPETVRKWLKENEQISAADKE